MGILTLLRNAFGRSRTARATEPEGATETPAHSPSVPDPRHTSEEHELVAAAFDKVKTPAQPTDKPEERTEEGPEEPTPATAEQKTEEKPPLPATTEIQDEAEEKDTPTAPAEAEPKAEETTEHPAT
ncbi:Toxic cation resistance protein, partial [Streptomyces sp. NPDC052727]